MMQHDTIEATTFLKRLIYQGCLAILLILVSTNVYGQEIVQYYQPEHYAPLAWFANQADEGVYSKKVNISLHQVTFEEALHRIATAGSLRISYDKNLLPQGSFTLVLQNVSIIEAFQRLLGGTGMEVLGSPGGQVIIKKEHDIPDVDASANDVVVQGTVIDANTGRPMPGVNIAVEGKGRGTSTGTDGEFQMEIANTDTVLSFSYIGYSSRQITVGEQDVIEVAMSSNISNLDEMVVIGYSSVKKSSLTSAISKVENVRLDQIPVIRPETALVGRIAGLHISQTRNRPGDAPDIVIRGPGSISASNTPLIVIDGFAGGSFDDINMNDIESVEVLKDASAAAIYGSRGAGGVIIVTTRKGRSGDPPRFNLNLYYGISNPILHGEDNWILDGDEFFEYTARYNNRDFFYAGGDYTLPLDSPLRPDNFRPGADRQALTSGGHNWEDILFNPSPIQNYNLSVAGGTDNTTYYLSGTLMDEQGTFRSTAYRQYAMRARYNVDVSESTRVGVMLSPQYKRTRLPGGAGIQNLIKFAPFVSPNPRDDGSYYRMPDYVSHVTVSSGPNPKAALDRSHYYNHVYNSIGELFLSKNFRPNLNFRTSIAGKLRFRENERFTESVASSTGMAFSSEFRDRAANLLNENYLTYTDSFRTTHNIEAILGASFQHEGIWSSYMSSVPGTFVNETIRTLNNAVINPGETTSFKTQWGLASFFTRVNYGYDEKYLLSASIRTDGSSRFGPNTRWGSFPALSAAWRVTQEDFMSGIQAINELKLRASYGVTGNFNIGDFAYLGTVGEFPYSPGGKFTIGLAQDAYGNPDLKWEKTYSYGVGLELSVFSHRLNFTLDLYDQTTKDLLYSVNTPAITGFSSALTNVGDINNRGIELEINTTNILTSSFQWSTSFNYSYNRNKVVKLGDDVAQRTNMHPRGMGWILREGEPMFSYYGHRMIGVIQSEEELSQVPVMIGQPVGTVKFEDVNGDGIINDDDRVILGNFMPDFYLGMVNDFRWRNFDLNIVMQASVGGKIYNHENLYYQGATTSALLRPLVEGQWWSPEEPGDGEHPAASLAVLQYVASSDYYLEDATFLAVRSINFGYTLPNSLLSRFNVNNLRIYMSITNPVMLTRSGFHAYNPEGRTAGINNPNSFPGFNDGSEPLNRTIAFGLNMNF